MKITCQSCQAKYTIADEKVLGKIVKIRCKKCSSTIVVNGSDGSGATAEMGGAMAGWQAACASPTFLAVNRTASRPMSDGFQALSEREKETLRLLLGGHDIKSIAAGLGLSVHTVNERLREARRNPTSSPGGRPSGAARSPR